MSVSVTNPDICVVLLDIEGTTTPIDFVYKALFPYARANAGDFLASRLTELTDDIEGLMREHAEDVTPDRRPPAIAGNSVEKLAAYVQWLMDRDRKTTALKSLQGKIWQAGYLAGELHSQVYEDVPRAFERWHEQGKKICIYSSGSVLAQKLLFANTEEGDLTRFIDCYFDTHTGPKREAASYRRIAEDLEVSSSAMVFVSDVTEELEAAASAGLETFLCVRPGNQLQPGASDYNAIASFDEVFK